MALVKKLGKQKEILEANDGVRQFSIYSSSSYDAGPSFDSTQITHLKITDHRHDMNEISKSFINFDFECTVSFSQNVKPAPSDQDMYGIEYAPSIQYFIGWKNSSDLLKSLQIEHNNVDTNYIQQECSRESFCMNCMKPMENKIKNKYVHSIYDDCRCGNISGVCGTYITLKPGTELSGDQKCTFSIVLPISDITCLQSMPDFPTTLGELVLKFSINPLSMVWCQCDPYEILQKQIILETNNRVAKSIDKKYKNLSYERRFCQMNQSCRCIIDYATPTLGDQTCTIKSLICKKCTCDIYGYNISTDSKQKIYNLFDETMYLPSQQLDVITFIDKYYGGSYDSNISQQIHNVTNFIVVIPESSNTYTVYRNPMLHNLQFICDSIAYPHKPFENTYDSRFYTTMMRSGDQENFFEADNDYRNSIFRKRLQNHQNSLSDNTSFMISFQVEKNCNGYYYDGIDTNTKKVSIQLRFSSSDLNTFQNNNQKPQVWFVRDTYWTLNNKEGLRYHKSGSPPIA